MPMKQSPVQILMTEYTMAVNGLEEEFCMVVTSRVHPTLAIA